MTSPDSLRTLLAQARLLVRRAQDCIEHEPRLRYAASVHCNDACSLIDHVMGKLAEQPAESEAAE